MRLWGEVDGCGEEFGAGEVLADHEDAGGRHGLRGGSEVGELVRMRRASNPWEQMRRTAAMVSEAVRR